MDKKRGRILEAADAFGQDIVHLGSKQVGLIANLAIITRRAFIFYRLTK